MGTCSIKNNEAFPKWGHAPSGKTRLSPNGDVLPQEKRGFPQVGTCSLKKKEAFPRI